MRKFFSPDSFWNQPIAANAEIDPQSRPILELMEKGDPRGFWLNTFKWTIPVYDVDSKTPRRTVLRRFTPASGGALARSVAYLTPDHPMGFGAAFAADAAAGRIPIPDYAVPDPETDAHIALVDWESGWIWDMWAAQRRKDGQWVSNTGMKYRLDGPGYFDRSEFAVHNGESIHPYGPGRAAGVPILAGLIMHDEVTAGRIEHRLSFGTQNAALQKFIYPPACWTDGGWRNGVPEGATVQLDPSLNLEKYNLSPAAKVVARALQEYGAVCVDVAGGHPMYAEGLYADPRKRTWEGLLKGDDLFPFKFANFRVLKLDNLVPLGQGPRKPDGYHADPE